MSKSLKIIFFICLEIIIITCFTLCNKQTNLPPSSEYDCSGLIIDQLTNKDDKYCCYWNICRSKNSKRS